MKVPRWQVWLHRIGYVATAIVVAEVAAIGWIVGAEWWRRHQLLAAQIERTAAHQGPLREPYYVKRYLAYAPPLGALGRDGLRFLALPALDDKKYVLALRLRPGATVADGVLVIFDEPHGERAGIKRLPIALPAATYRQLFGSIDRRMHGFGGNAETFTDGTAIAIERRDGDRLISGEGNFIEPYRTIGEEVLAVLRAAAPSADLPPSGENWYHPATFSDAE